LCLEPSFLKVVNPGKSDAGQSFILQAQVYIFLVMRQRPVAAEGMQKPLRY
jgi:hypothetical protein